MAVGISKGKWTNEISIHNGNFEFNNLNGNMSLHYDGKKSYQKVVDEIPIIDISEIYSDGRSEKRLYFGDNLSILKLLMKDPDVFGKVKLIYIDPPFATNSVFKSRNQKESYMDTLSGVQYIEYIRRRLILLRELMAKDGSIYVHLDQNMAFHIKIIMDEIFGQNNFRNWITRKKCNPKNYTRKQFGNISDFILFYSKSNNYIWNRQYIEWDNESVKREYPYIEEKTGRRYKKVPIHAPGTRNGETGKPWRGMNPPPGKHWQYVPSKLDEMERKGEIYWSPNGNPRRKIYLDDSKGIPVQDIWLDLKDAHNQMIKITGYPTEKNPELLNRIIRASSNEGDLVMDCFSGSGTTLAAASDLNRKWIGIDNSIEAIRTTLERIVSGPQRMGDFVEKENDTMVQEILLPFSDDFDDSKKPLIEKETLKKENGFGLFSVSSEKQIVYDTLKKVTGR